MVFSCYESFWANPRSAGDAGGRWTVAVLIDGKRFDAEDGIEYVLEVEAAKESLNLGRRLVDLGRS